MRGSAAAVPLLLLLLATPTNGLRYTPSIRRRAVARVLGRCASPRFAQPAAAPGDAEEVQEEQEIGGVVLNEELKVMVQYLGGAASRQRRVRRTRRPPPEERWRLSAEPAGYQRMSAFCNYATIDLEAAIDLIASNQAFRRFGERISITSYSDVVHCRMTSPPVSSAQPIVRDAFLFPYGSAVLWGFPSLLELDFLDLLAPCSEDLSASISGVSTMELGDSEFMLYTLEDGPEASAEAAALPGAAAAPLSPPATASARAVTLSNNVIRLSPADNPVEKLSISFAFAQSAKLAVFEALLEESTEAIKPIPEQLAASGRSQLTVKQVSKLTGRVFLERNEVNLYSNILDTPDFFWEAEEFEPLYQRVNRYLDIEDRVAILNKRLDIVNDLLDSLSTQLEVKHSHRLEVIIIWLIVIEIAIELVKESALPGPVKLLLRGWALLRGRGAGAS